MGTFDYCACLSYKQGIGCDFHRKRVAMSEQPNGTAPDYTESPEGQYAMEKHDFETREAEANGTAESPRLLTVNEGGIHATDCAGTLTEVPMRPCDCGASSSGVSAARLPQERCHKCGALTEPPCGYCGVEPDPRLSESDIEWRAIAKDLTTALDIQNTRNQALTESIQQLQNELETSRSVLNDQIDIITKANFSLQRAFNEAREEAQFADEKWEKAAARIKELTDQNQQLRSYVQHAYGCEKARYPSGIVERDTPQERPTECTCGLADVLKVIGGK